MIESEISKGKQYLLNDDFMVNPTEYVINGDEDLVISYTSSKQVTGAIAMIKEWKYAKSFTSNTITFSNSDFEEGLNEISVVDVNYSDGSYGRFTDMIRVTKRAGSSVSPPVPPAPTDNPPSISQNIQSVSVEIGNPVELSYTAIDDKEIVNHEFYNGETWVKLWPTPIGDTYYFTIRFDTPGIKKCQVRVTDSKGQISLSNVFNITVNVIPVINTPPSVTINSADANYNGEYSVKYTLLDNENDNMQVSFKIGDGEYFVIASSIKNGIHTYRGGGLQEGSHDITLKVFDGVNVVEESFSIAVPVKPVMPISRAILYDKTGKVKIGDLDFILDDGKSVEEERNGIFELIFNYPNKYPLADQLIEENFIEVKPNDDQAPQKFRIYNTKKILSNIITVFARHETFDLANDHVENINLPNASCEYALNTLFRNSHFSKDFRGYSDIVNAQDFKIENTNILNAIAGKEGSIIDTYGTGAEILRNGKNIHVLNKRGHDNGVTIEYGKNITGFELNVDLTGLETRCGGFAKYRPSGSQEEVVVKSDWVDSPFINNFSHPYISTQGRRDYSNKFKDGDIPTKEKLNRLCADEFKINKRDIPANNYKINFIPLSKCVGYEGIEDKISLCDTVTIIDPRFNINTKAKVIKYKYDFVKERYISMELGEPRTTLGDIIGGGKPEQGPPGKDGKDGQDGKDGVDGSVEDFPDTLPNVPVLTAKVKGFDGIELSWTYESKVYYTYELFASKTKDFKPNTFDLIHEGQASSFYFNAKPGETWHFRVCAKNTYGNRTGFSDQVTVTTKKAEDFEEYFSELAVRNLVADIFSVNYMEAGIIKGHWIDGRNLSVTDGDGRRTFDMNSYGKLTLQPSSMKVLIDDKVEFLGTGGERNMALYGGQMCAFNSTNNRFLSTAGAIIAPNFGIRGSGFLMSKHCNHFLIGRDAEWDDIYANRSPKPTHYFDMDFENYQIKLGLPLLTGDVNLRGSSLYDAQVGYIKDWYGFGWKQHSTGQQLMYAEGNVIKIPEVIPFRCFGSLFAHGNFYTDNLYFNNGHQVFCISPGTTNVVSNGAHWDFNGMDLVNARIVSSFIGTSVINNQFRVSTMKVNSEPINEEPELFDEIKVVERKAHRSFSVSTSSLPSDSSSSIMLDMSNVSNKDEIMIDDKSADLGKLVTILFKKVKEQDEKIKNLENIVNDLVKAR